MTPADSSQGKPVEPFAQTGMSPCVRVLVRGLRKRDITNSSVRRCLAQLFTRLEATGTISEKSTRKGNNAPAHWRDCAFHAQASFVVAFCKSERSQKPSKPRNPFWRDLTVRCYFSGRCCLESLKWILLISENPSFL